MPSHSSRLEQHAFVNSNPVPEIALECSTRVSCLLAASDRVINKNSKRGEVGRWGGGGGERPSRRDGPPGPVCSTEANFGPLCPAWPDLSEMVSSFLWVLPWALGNQEARGEVVVRQAWAPQASIHVPGNTAFRCLLTTLGR